jgi:Transposase, Mutator family
VRLKIPKLRRQTFETAIIERYRRRESSVEEALIEMISRRRFGAPGRGHHGSLVGGGAGISGDGIGPEQEDLRGDPGITQSPNPGRAPLVARVSQNEGRVA